MDDAVEFEFVGVFEFGGGDFGDGRREGDDVVVADWFFVAAGEFDDDEEEASFFHVTVVAAAGAEEFRAAHFEEGGVVAVMKESHGVGLVVPDADLHFVSGQHGFDVRRQAAGCSRLVDGFNSNQRSINLSRSRLEGIKGRA